MKPEFYLLDTHFTASDVRDSRFVIVPTGTLVAQQDVLQRNLQTLRMNNGVIRNITNTSVSLHDIRHVLSCRHKLPDNVL